MNISVLLKNYNQPDFCEKEILRYAGCSSADCMTLDLMNSCIAEVKPILVYKTCYTRLSVKITGDICDFGVFKFKSQDLAKNLFDVSEVIVFAATVGVGLDRLIAKYSRLSPSRALMLQAIGAQRIEAVCDAFCKDLADELKVTLKPRFSPGYGDLPLGVQKNIFDLLDCSKLIGITLNESLLMSPTKSVTAFVGIKKSPLKDEKA